MKLRSIFQSLLLLSLFATGCGNEAEVLSVELSSAMESNVLKFDNEGGTGIIHYSLTNAPSGTSVEAICEADWIVNLTVGEDILFSVLPNDDAVRSTEIVVSYENQSFKVTVEQSAKAYVYDVTFSSASRTPQVGLHPDNYIYIKMSDEATNSKFQALLLCAENENILVAGLYNDDLSNVDSSVSKLTIDGEQISFKNCFNSFVVEGDVNNYSIVAKFTDSCDQQYRIRFNGIIDGMNEFINHYPETDVAMEATAIMGEYKGRYPSNTFQYNIYLSDNGFTEANGLMAGGRYINLDLYGLEIVADDEGYYTIPAGTYTINEEFYKEDWSLRPDHSSYIVVNADLTGYYTYCIFDSATVIVTEDSIRLEATSCNITYTATYNGVPKFM